MCYLIYIDKQAGRKAEGKKEENKNQRKNGEWQWILNQGSNWNVHTLLGEYKEVWPFQNTVY